MYAIEKVNSLRLQFRKNSETITKLSAEINEIEQTVPHKDC
jgi:hypothetical protein